MSFIYLTDLVFLINKKSFKLKKTLRASLKENYLKSMENSPAITNH